MKPLSLSADQARVACQADAFLVHLANKKFSGYPTIREGTRFHVGLYPLESGVHMNVGVQISGQTFLVRRPFKSYSSTSAIYYGCVEMIQQLQRSVNSVSLPEVWHKIGEPAPEEEGDINQEYTKKHWAWPHLPPKGLEPDLGDLSDWTPDKYDHDVNQYIADDEDDDDPEYLDFLNNQGQDD